MVGAVDGSRSIVHPAHDPTNDHHGTEVMCTHSYSRRLHQRNTVIVVSVS